MQQYLHGPRPGTGSGRPPGNVSKTGLLCFSLLVPRPGMPGCPACGGDRLRTPILAASCTWNCAFVPGRAPRHPGTIHEDRSAVRPGARFLVGRGQRAKGYKPTQILSETGSRSPPGAAPIQGTSDTSACIGIAGHVSGIAPLLQTCRCHRQETRSAGTSHERSAVSSPSFPLTPCGPLTSCGKGPGRGVSIGKAGHRQWPRLHAVMTAWADCAGSITQGRLHRSHYRGPTTPGAASSGRV